MDAPLAVRVDGPPQHAGAARERLTRAGLECVHQGGRVLVWAGPATTLPARCSLDGMLPLVLLSEPEDAALEKLAGGDCDELLPLQASDAELGARLRALVRRCDGTGLTGCDEGLVARLGHGIAVLDGERRVLRLNPAGARILGIVADTARGRAWAEIAPPEDAASALLFRELAAGARVLEADLRVRLPDGRAAVIAVSAGPLHSGRLALSFRDSTEQREMEAALRRTKDFLERVIDASTDAIVAADLRGRFIVFSRAAEKLFGVSAADARAKLRVQDLYPAGGAQEVLRLLKESPTGQIQQVRTYGRGAGDELVPVELSAALVRVGATPVATLGVFRDLSERTRVEAELARARARLNEAEKQAAITALAGATAHELNQPLTVITGWVELLRRRLDEPHRTQLEAVAREAERMAAIVRRISRLTRVETVEYPGDRQIADLERSTEPLPPATGGKHQAP